MGIWPNTAQALDYSTVSADELNELDRLAGRTGLLAGVTVGDRPYAGDYSPASDELVAALSQAQGRWWGSTADGENLEGRFDREESRAAAHAWHLIRSGGLFVGVDPHGTYAEWFRDGFLGDRCYRQFCSVWELERYNLSWLLRGAAWANRLLELELRGVVVTSTGDTRVMRVIARRLREGLEMDMRARDYDLSQWLGVSGQGAFSWQEGLVHIHELWHLQQEVKRLLLIARRSAPERFGSNAERAAWRAARRAETKALNQMAHRMANATFRRLGNLREAFVTEVDALNREARVEAARNEPKGR